MKVTIYNSIYDKQVFHIEVDAALDRIRDGKSADRVVELRGALDKDKAEALKKELPVVAFAGEFTYRGDKHLAKHSGYLIADIDKLENVEEKMAQMRNFPHTYAAWISPSGNGVKALIRIADGSRHREHFQALREIFPELDASGVNEERLCFESYDPNMYRNPNATAFGGVLTEKKITERVDATNGDDALKFQMLLKWIANKKGAFAKGSRNTFVFVLAGACCRYGMDVQTAASLIAQEFPTCNDFSGRELMTTVKSAYKTNSSSYGTVRFEKEQVVNIRTRKVIKLEDLPDFDPETPPRDVIYGAEVKAQALDIYDHGHASVSGIDVPEFDKRWKAKRGEVTCLTGYGNAGKSALYKWYQLMRVLLYGERFASFSPEDNPPEEYYHDFVEMLLGCDCTPANHNSRPSREVYERAYDWICKHIFYLYPKDEDPTPEYIKSRFLEIIVKEKVDGICIDPFNQLSNEYGARSDKYLESIFGDFARFAQANQVYFMIIAHPKQPSKDASGNFPCPDRYDLADGAMWNNKMDNIIVYHRPFISTNPDDPTCEFHSKKVRRQKTVGRPGFVEMRYIRFTRRFVIGTDDPMERIMQKRGLNFYAADLQPEPILHIPYTSTPLILPDDFWEED